MRASDPIPLDRPFDLDFAERIPLLQIFEWALKNHVDKKSFVRLMGGLFPIRKLYAAECGVFRGRGLAACLKIAKKNGVNVHFTGLDTFAGFPPLSKEDVDAAPQESLYLTKRMFADTSVDFVKNLLKQEGVSKSNYTLLPGFFKDTLPLLKNRKYFFVNIDCDLYEPHLECLNYFYPRMVKGGVIFLDDYHSPTYPMAKKAVDEFFKDKSEKLFHMRFGPEGDNLTKCFIIKN